MCKLISQSDSHTEALKEFCNQHLNMQVEVTHPEGDWHKATNAGVKPTVVYWHVYKANVTAAGHLPDTALWVPITCLVKNQLSIGHVSKAIIAGLKARGSL